MLESVHGVDAVLALASGEPAEAIAAIQRSFDAGDMSLPYFRLHPVWDPLRAEPDFRAIIASYEQKMAAQRERLKEQGM